MKETRIHDSIEYDVEKMDTEEYALRRAVAAARHDMTPRLVFSDWLEDHDRHNEANFIRTMIARSEVTHQHKSKSKGRPPCQACKLRRETVRLWKLLAPGDRKNNPTIHLIIQSEVGGKLAAGRLRLPISIYPDHRAGVYKRGFVEELRMTAREWLQVGDALYDQYPITKVGLIGGAPRFAVNPVNGACQFVGDQVAFTHDQVRKAAQLQHEQMMPNWNPFSDPSTGLTLCKLRWPGVEFWETPPQIELYGRFDLIDIQPASIIGPGMPVRVNDHGRVEPCERTDPQMIGVCEGVGDVIGTVRVRLTSGGLPGR